jgi:eukaryotic-like serine/threonine-protein kinase
MAKLIARLSHALQKKKTTRAGSPDSAFGIGAMIDKRYQLDAEIGRGGMGIVYRAHDISNGRDVAIKIIDPGAASALTLAQFSREAEILARLHHPHLVTVYETGAVDTGTGHPSPFLVLELVQGVRLDEMRTLTYPRIIDIAKQICEAVQYVHDQGFVYRDLKSGNVILEKCGFRYCVKLLDFGLARPRGSAYLPTESTRAGTSFYLAPELIAGQPADVGSDLYALGVTLYEMITGHVPFANIDEQNILSQHLEERVRPPSQSRSDVPPMLESIVLRLLEKNPEDRFTSTQEVWDVLSQILLKCESSARGNLLQTNIAGRENQVARVIQLLESNPLVTLLDDDESLAVAVGAQLMDRFTDGVWLVRLESVADPAKVLEAVAAVLGVPEDSNRSPTFSIIETLREKNLLLLLSHCGHLPAACAQLAETILRACPEIYILATSHQPLNTSSEKGYRGAGKSGE